MSGWHPRHGLSKTKEYNSWSCMKARCSNPKGPNYARYGGRGIRVCERWEESFLAFYFDMGSAPGPHHSLERVDNDGNYEPGNVVWATPIEQAQNTSFTRIVEVDGIALSVGAWIRRTGISRASLYARVARGWSWERAVATPPDISKFNKMSREKRGL